MAGVRVADVYLGDVALGEDTPSESRLVPAPIANGEQA
jgi:hypothetical protein